MNIVKTNVVSEFKLPAVFVVSSGRSGTTLLASILNATEQIHIPYESDFIARAYPFYCDRDNLTQADYQAIAKFFRLTSKEQGWGMSESYLLECLQKSQPQTFAEVNSVLYRAFFELHGTEHLQWGIKAPVLIASLERILDTVPQHKLVHIVRDGRDVYLSYKTVHQKSQIKFGPKGIVSNALYWVDGLRRIQELKAQNPHQHIYELRYEDLLCNPEAELKQLCDFLDIDYNPSIHDTFYNLERNQKVAPQNFMQSIHTKVQGGLDPQNVQKYQSKTSKLEQFVFDLIALPYLEKYQYQSQFPWLKTKLFAPIRILFYFAARQINNWRYQKRDRLFYHRSQIDN